LAKFYFDGRVIATKDGRSGGCENQYCEVSQYPVIRALRDVTCCLQANARFQEDSALETCIGDLALFDNA
jgi:hypothetical protein